MDQQHLFNGVLLETHLIELTQQVKELLRLEKEEEIMLVFFGFFGFLWKEKHNVLRSLKTIVEL